MNALIESFGTEFATDPNRVWAGLRSRSPVWWSAAFSAWLVTGQRAAQVVLSDRRFDPVAYRQARPSPLPLPSSFELSSSDKARFHRVVWSCMAARGLPVEGLAQAAMTVLDALAAKPAGEAAEWVSQVAEPVAREATRRVLGIDGSELDELLVLMAEAGSGSPYAHQQAAARLFTTTMLAHIAHRRAAPADDLLCRLARAWEAHRLRDEWLVAFVSPMLHSLVRGFGGRLITHTAAHLASDLAVQDLVADGGLDAARRAVMEAARLDPINQSLRRYARQDVELDGARITRGQLVLVIVPAICRDPAVYPDPDAFRLDRSTRSMAFGYGPHACSGRDLAVAIAACVFEQLLMVGGMRLRPAPAALPDYRIEFGRSCVRLPLLIEPRARGDAQPPYQFEEGAP